MASGSTLSGWHSWRTIEPRAERHGFHGSPVVTIGFNTKSWSSMTTGWFLGYLHENSRNYPYLTEKILSHLYFGVSGQVSGTWKNVLHFTVSGYRLSTALSGTFTGRRVPRSYVGWPQDPWDVPACHVWCSLSHPEPAARNWSRQNHREVPKRRDSVVENICSTSDLPIFSFFLPSPMAHRENKT